jgi:putative (di)nucleoside polyphosphate hydrolase
VKKEFQALPYRNNVSMVVFRDDKFLLANRANWEDDRWKFPQGGTDGEDIVIAARREFMEELGSNKFEVVGVSRYTNSYDWPDELIIKLHSQWKGQSQGFVFIRFLGDDEDLNRDPEEITAFKWVTKEDILEYSKDSEHKYFGNYNGLMPKILEELESIRSKSS